MKVLRTILIIIFALSFVFIFLTIGGMEAFMFSFETGLTRIAAGFLVALVSGVLALLI